MPGNWRVVDTLEIRSRLSVSDTAFFWDDFVEVHTPPATYEVSIRVIVDEGYEHVAAVRVVQATRVAVERGPRVGEVGIGFAQMGFCDREAVERWFTSIPDNEISIYYDQLDNRLRSGRALLPSGTKIVYVSTGYGAGTYTVHSLLDADKQVVGIEIDFLENIVMDTAEDLDIARHYMLAALTELKFDFDPVPGLRDPIDVAHCALRGELSAEEVESHRHHWRQRQWSVGRQPEDYAPRMQASLASTLLETPLSLPPSDLNESLDWFEEVLVCLSRDIEPLRRLRAHYSRLAQGRIRPW